MVWRIKPEAFGLFRPSLADDVVGRGAVLGAQAGGCSCSRPPKAYRCTAPGFSGATWSGPGGQDWQPGLGLVARYRLVGRETADGFEPTAGIAPVDPFACGDLNDLG